MIVVLMGVSGAGKTAVGESLAARIGWPFVAVDTTTTCLTIPAQGNQIELCPFPDPP